MSVVIISGSARTGRLTPRATDFIARAFSERTSHAVTIHDLREMALPPLRERLVYLENAPQGLRAFSRAITTADILVVVSPEYNGGCPGELKNALDYLTGEYENKPVGIVTVSSGPHGGDRCFQMLTTLFTRVGARVSPVHCKIVRVAETLTEQGEERDENYTPLARSFVESLTEP